MCNICNELDKLTTIEAVRNLSETIESVGKEHAREVMETIAAREIKLLDDQGKDHDSLESLKALMLSTKMMKHILNDEEMPTPEEFVVMDSALLVLEKEFTEAKDLKTK